MSCNFAQWFSQEFFPGAKFRARGFAARLIIFAPFACKKAKHQKFRPIYQGKQDCLLRLKMIQDCTFYRKLNVLYQDLNFPQKIKCLYQKKNF